MGLGSIRVSSAALVTAVVKLAYDMESEEQASTTLVWKTVALTESLRPIHATFGVAGATYERPLLGI